MLVALGLNGTLACTTVVENEDAPQEVSGGEEQPENSTPNKQPEIPDKTEEDSETEKGDSLPGNNEKGSSNNKSPESPESPENPESPDSETPGGDSSTDSDEGNCVDGSKRECSELENGQAIKFPGGIPRGSCRMGTQTCEKGRWSPCYGAVAPAEKDTCEPENDDNCNGRPTDHCGCVAGETQECGSDVGVCEKGELTCLDNGKWGEDCKGEIEPTDEICDGKADENCDGKSDEENCECINGETVECGQSDQGECRLGTKTCQDGKWGGCVGAVGPKPERCDGRGKDEDCDGNADTDDSDCECNNGQSKACKVPGKRGDCELGVVECRGGKWENRCKQRFYPGREICGRLTDPKDDLLGPRPGDEDCDGLVDESDSANQFSPGGPSHLSISYMRDEDGDGWGAMLPPGKPRSYVSRKYCQGRESQVPRGWVRANANAMKDCGDCPGTGHEVNPDYRGNFRAKPNQCLQEVRWKHGAFDYNCSRTEERQYQDTHICEQNMPACEQTRRSGWLGPVASCGSTKSWLNASDCFPDESINECTGAMISRKQTQLCK